MTELQMAQVFVNAVFQGNQILGGFLFGKSRLCPKPKSASALLRMVERRWAMMMLVLPSIKNCPGLPERVFAFAVQG